MPKCCWATITAIPRRRSRRWQASAAKWARAPRCVYARGSDLAAESAQLRNRPVFRPVHLRARRTAATACNGEYFATANFDGKQHRPRELTYPSSGQIGRRRFPPIRSRCSRASIAEVDFHWWDGAPRADMNDDDFGVRWSGYLSAPATGKYQLGAIGMNAFELYFDGKPRRRPEQHPRAQLSATATVDLEGRKALPHPPRLPRVRRTTPISAWCGRAPPAAPKTEAAIAARQADAVVLVLGLSPRLEGEEMSVPVEGFQGGDRVDSASRACRKS